MFSTAIQPSIVSLFSSTGTDPLRLFITHTDALLSSDSFIHLLNDSSSTPSPPPPAAVISTPPIDQGTESVTNTGYSVDQTVLHMQSPTISTTYIRCPAPQPSRGSILDASHGKAGGLGLKHPWMHLQVRNMGREWSFEVGLVDNAAHVLIVRCSTFQKQPRLTLPTKPGSLPLLHLPLSFPSPSSRPLTAWSTIALHLPPLLQSSSLAPTTLQDEVGVERDTWTTRAHTKPGTNTILPSGSYSHISYVKVYATCRLRRIWFSESGPSQKVPWEFELYAAE